MVTPYAIWPERYKDSPGTQDLSPTAPKLKGLDLYDPSYLESLPHSSSFYYPAIGSATGPTCVRHKPDFPPTKLER